VGELSQPGQAILPIVAAVGGIVLPACLFLLMSRGEPGSEGWGVPMATDIAFSLGLLMLLGNRVPSSLKIFLTAFAIVDDLVAVAIIAVFYSSSINLVNLGWAAGVYVLMWGLNISNIRNGLAYFALAAIMWYFFLKGGIHPTVAGILAALAIPANSNLRMKSFVEKSRSALDQFWDENSNKLQQFLTNEQLNAIDDIDDNIEKVQPPLQRLEHGLNAQVNYFIMPVFALANAGVTLQSSEGGAVIGNLTWYVMLSLVMGKVVGITLFSWLAVQLKWAELPAQTNWINMVGVGLLGGVGFTMALFIGGLAFTNLALLNQAKIGILLGSLIAGTMGVLVLRLSLPKN
jgi:NhaA family Na+:H+ antiporter